MADMTAKKRQFLNDLVSYAAKASALSREQKELADYATDNGFLTGGANAVVDADCTNGNAHLTAVVVNDAMTALSSTVLSTTNATRLRKASSTPVPK